MVKQKDLPVGSMTKEREPSTIVQAEQFNTMTTQPIVNSATDSNTGPGKIKIRFLPILILFINCILICIYKLL